MNGSNTFTGLIIVLIGLVFLLVGMRKRGAQLLKELQK